MKYLKHLLFVALTLSILVACQQSFSGSGGGQALNHVPNSASMVMAIDLNKVMDKIDFEAVKEMEFYKNMLDEVNADDEQVAVVLQDPAASGVDMNSKAYIFVNLDPDEQTNGGGLIFSLADVGKFKDLIATKATVEEGKGFSYMIPEKDAVVAWNDNVAFIGGMDNADAVTDLLVEVFEGKNSIRDETAALKALNGSHDIMYWTTTNQIAEAVADEIAGDLPIINADDLKGNSIYGYADFNKGEVKGVGFHDLTKGLLGNLKLIFREKSTTDFSKYLPKEDLVSLMGGSINPKGIKQLIQDMQMAGMADIFLKGQGLSLDDITNAIQGDMVVATYKNDDSKEPKMVMGLSLDDKSKFQKLLDMGVASRMMSKKGKDSYVIGGAMMGMGSAINISITDNKMFVCNDPSTTTKIQSGGFSASERIDNKAMKVVKNNLYGMYMNFEGLAEMAGSDVEMINDQIEDMTSYSNWKKSEFSMKFKNKTDNSLKVLMEMLNQQYLQSEGADKRITM